MLEIKDASGVLGVKPMRPVVLAVDDEVWILRAIQRVMRHEPYDILATDRPEQALDWVMRGDVSVVISDQRMPGMSGTELLDRVRKCSPTTGCVILTGHPGGTVIIKGFTAGVDRMLNKPWDDDVLRRTVRQLVREREIGPLREGLEES
jgi:DNA-binding response OmpR family regulator